MESASDISLYTTVGGYAVILGLTGLLYYAYNNTGNRRAGQTAPNARQARSVAPEPAAPPKAKVSKPKPKAKPAVSPKPAEPAPSGESYSAAEIAAAEAKADREFARQLASAHTGTNFTSSKKEEKRQKSVKQSKAQEKRNAPEAAAVESANAGDADDDLSPQTSPVVEASSGRDVSDMLEPASDAPSVLRLTNTEQPKPKAKKAKAPEVVETKKQRQNRKKAEAAKAAREEDEKERQVLLEQQRRTARVAEGRAAKDGSAFMASQKANAWDEKKDASAPVALLDTFDEKPKEKPAKSTTAASKNNAEADAWMSGVPSEEEQMELLAQEDSWSEVKTKKKSKKNNGLSEAATNSASANTAPAASVPAAKAAPVNGTSTKAAAPAPATNSAFAALATDEPEEVDQEWDV